MVQIITDSAADFEPEEMERLGIKCIPLSVSFGAAQYQENVNLSKDLFYRLLETEKEFPRTSQPFPYSFQCAMEEAVQGGNEAVFITLSSALSGTYQTAVMVQKMFGYERCFVVDSRTASGGQRILVEQAVKLRDQGKGAQEIADCLKELRSRIALCACLDTLEYLRRGGRISLPSAAIGSLLKIKPIIHVTIEGTVEIIAKRRGTKSAMEELYRQITISQPDEAYPFYVMYTQNPQNGLVLAEKLYNYGKSIAHSHMINVGAAIGSHIGPNAFGIVYVTSQGGR